MFPTKGECNARWCGNPSKTEHNGREYCGIHDPDMLAARKVKREATMHAKYLKEKAEREARWKKEATATKRRKAEEAACSRISTEALVAGVVERMRVRLQESILQIEHMHEVFQETSTGNAEIAKIEALLTQLGENNAK